MKKPDFSDEPSEELNRKMHAMQGDIARQVPWSVNGNVVKVDQDDYRHFFVAHVRKGTKIMPKIDGDGIVILGASSKSLKKAEKVAMIDLMYAFGAVRNVQWSDPRERAFMEYYGSQK